MQFDKDIILKAFSQNSEIYRIIPKEYKSNIEFLNELVKLDPLIVNQFEYELQNNKIIILTAISEIGVDALWGKKEEVFRDIDIMIAALISPYGQDSWEPILNGVGGDAHFSKNKIETAYNIFGEEILEHDFNWILAQDL